VGDLLESLADVATDTLGGRVGRSQFRVLALKVLQLAEHSVELEIADERLRVHIVLVIILVYQSSKLLDTLTGIVDVVEITEEIQRVKVEN
jgi:hypothetical protein